MEWVNNSEAPVEPLNQEDVIVDDSDGKQAIASELAAFAKKYPDTATSGLPRPYVQDALVGVPSADFGISNDRVEDNEGVQIIVPAYPNMKEGDRVRVFWGKGRVGSIRVSAAQVGSYLTVRVDAENVPRSLQSLYYKVGNRTREEKSPTVTTLYRFGQPGVQGTTGAGQELAAPTVALPASGSVGANDARASVKVTVPAYLNMKVHDVITLFWGDELIDHVVTQDQVGKPVVIEVSEAVIKRAGDSDALPVYYFVTDEVGNESEWSGDQWVKVNLADLELEAPVVLDGEGAANSSGEIELGNVDVSPVVIEVSGPFEEGDSVVLNWVGTTDAGQEIPLSYGPVSVTQGAATQRFEVPYEVLTALGGGVVRLTHTLVRNGKQTTSKAAFINIKGAPARLPAPWLHKSEDYWVDPDLPANHVRIPAQAGLQEEDEVTVKWLATASDGTTSALSSKMFRVTKNRAGKTMSIRLARDPFFKPFDGGWVDVSYEIKRGTRVLRSEVVRYDIGEPAETLPAPFTEPTLPDNVLNPELPDYELYMEIIVPPEAPKPTPSTVTVIWETSEGGYYEDEQVLQAGDEVSPFQIPAEELAIKGDEPVKVWAYYLVEWEGKPTQVSEDFIFRIATPAMLRKNHAPVHVPSAGDGKLDLGQVSGDGLKVEIPQYEGMAVGDRILIKFGDSTVKEHVVTQVGKQTVTLSQRDLAGLDGKKNVVMTYEVVRYPSGDKIVSQPVTFELEGVIKPSALREEFEEPNHPVAWLKAKSELDYPTMKIRCLSGQMISGLMKGDGGRPMGGRCFGLHATSVVSFELKTGPVRQVSFDCMVSLIHPLKIELFSDKACTDKVGDLKVFPLPKGTERRPGYAPNVHHLSYTSPDKPILSFKVSSYVSAPTFDNFEFVLA
ncbi:MULTISPECIES: hypothetical protein [unclassified Pseudomonas]|uniref:hypothetical protein n=1 Tax=unclassified Pseudomonas TaxID=196821 RepID=UPI00244B577C|nr:MULTISPECIES: hypothetical protein [unclassified Pseudomonas]MDH0302392.1 hypothetical protein [Pseudomonas sp. GD04091]MDH1984834.1 hypothetical protein [Pseudomonas sp. GD03689]